MDERLTRFTDAGIALAVAAGQSEGTTNPAVWEDYLEQFRLAAAATLPRTHKRLRVPVDVVARMLQGLGTPPHPYARFLLPPSVSALSAAQLDDPAIAPLAADVMAAWSALIGDLAPVDAVAEIQSVLTAPSWRLSVDPGDFPTGVQSDHWGVWDASTRAALDSLPSDIPQAERLSLLLGLWSGSGRAPQLPADWVQAESWISASERIVAEERDLASARAWAVSSLSPLYRATDRDAVDAFVSWAYRRASTWPTFTSVDPQIHQRLREQWPTPPADHEDLWPDWVRTAVSSNTLAPASTGMRVVNTAATIDELLSDLAALIGLDTVKREITDVVNLVRLEQAKSQQGKPTAPVDLHMVFTGNPGTGKTTVARLYGQILRALGALRTGVFVEVTRADLVGPHKSEASERTRAALDAADGGVLFIDEAYSLATGRAHDDGDEVINELVHAMEARRGSVAVIVAGYTGPMAKFLDANPGLRSRFREPLVFPDMPTPALLTALHGLATAEGFRIDPAAQAPLRAWVAALPRGDGFGNAREMRTLLGILKQHLATRYAADPASVDVDLIVAGDVPLVGPGTFDQAAYDHAIENLNQLVGLQSVKDVIAGLADQGRLAHLLRDRGKPAAPIDIGHMVFTGNPGTGKTTVAARLGAILAAVGLLRSGHVHTVGRADLIGEYLGQTAPKVRAAIQQALDGVLFIDEAYALTAGPHWDSYAREAVATLVDEIERHRSRLVVIMAGYPDDMEAFLASNDGLKSRVRHTIDFPDFDREQLRQITIDMAIQRQKRITEDAADAITDQAMKQAGAPGFANARTVRNLLDAAITRHASRIVHASDSRQDTAALITIEREDVADLAGRGDVPFGFLA